MFKGSLKTPCELAVFFRSFNLSLGFFFFFSMCFAVLLVVFHSFMPQDQRTMKIIWCLFRLTYQFNLLWTIQHIHPNATSSWYHAVTKVIMDILFYVPMTSNSACYCIIYGSLCYFFNNYLDYGSALEKTDVHKTCLFYVNNFSF